MLVFFFFIVGGLGKMGVCVDVWLCVCGYVIWLVLCMLVVCFDWMVFEMWLVVFDGVLVVYVIY